MKQPPGQRLAPEGVALGRWICPVFSLKGFERRYRLLAVGPDSEGILATFHLAPLAPADRAVLSRRLEQLPLSDRGLHDLEVVIETNAPDALGLWHPWRIGLQVCAYALSLWLPNVAVPLAFMMDGDGLRTMFMEGLPPQVSSSTLDVALLPEIRRTVDAMPASFDVMRAAWSRFYDAGRRDDLLDQFLDYMIALESLVARGSGSEIAFTVATRTAILTCEDERKRPTVEKQVRLLYGLRSKIAHGDLAEALSIIDKRFGKSPARACFEARELCRRVVLAVLHEHRLQTKEGLMELSLIGRAPSRK